VATGSLVLRRFGGGRDRELAAGRFLASPKVTPEAIIDIHATRTAGAARGRRIAAIQDTTEVNFSGRNRSRRGLGRGGDGKSPGFFIHAAVAVDADSEQLLGVPAIHLRTCARHPDHCRSKKCRALRRAKPMIEPCGFTPGAVHRRLASAM
jgi:hypothetical protein